MSEEDKVWSLALQRDMKGLAGEWPGVRRRRGRGGGVAKWQRKTSTRTKKKPQKTEETTSALHCCFSCFGHGGECGRAKKGTAAIQEFFSREDEEEEE